MTSRRMWGLLVVILAMAYVSFAQQSGNSTDKTPANATDAVKVEKDKAAGSVLNATAPTIVIDRKELNNGGTLTVTGKAEAGKPVYIEVWSDDRVRVSRFDSDKDKDTGKIPYVLYMSEEMPAFYHIYTPAGMKAKLDEVKKQGRGWSYSQALKDLGADTAFKTPAGIKIDRYQATFIGSIVGQRGELLSAMDGKENRRRSMQLVKARFRSPGKVFSPSVEVTPDGSYTAKISIPKGSAPGKFFIAAVTDAKSRSENLVIENKISFPDVYMATAGTSLNVLWPFLLTLGIAVFGVLMGAGGGFILNPLLVSIWPLPHTIVAGTVMPTVLFSQASGVYNYSKIKFINWKLGTVMGLAMLLGGFIGPKLTEMITLDQFKFVFGWILVVLALLMFWQTTPGYLDKNKKEQAILNEFKKRAQEAARGK